MLPPKTKVRLFFCLIALCIGIVITAALMLNQPQASHALITSRYAGAPDPSVPTEVFDIPALPDAHDLPTSLQHPSPPRAAPKTPNPYESRLLQGASMLERRQFPANSRQPAREERLWRTDFKYPLIREEISFSRSSTEPAQRVFSVADHMLVRFPEGISDTRINEWAQQHGFYVRHSLQTTDVWLIATAEVGLDADKAILKAFEADFPKLDQPRIMTAERDYLVFPTVVPDDSSFGNLWGLNNTGQTGGLADADIDAPEAWEITTGTREVLVAVIDTGLDRNHPDLAANAWKNPREVAGNGVDDDGNGFVDDVYGWDFFANDNNPIDEGSHGTHCAGTIGAVGNNRAGIAGVCWQVSLVGIRFLGPSGGTTSDAIECVNYSTSLGVDLTSNSWGGGGSSTLLREAIEDAGVDQILFVAAAGNDGTDNDSAPHYPSNYPSENIISVASTTASDTRSSFSNYGLTSVDLAAPGSAIYSTVPGPSYGTLSGTSMATPHVTGALALAKGIAPLIGAQDLKAKLMSTADRLPAFTGLTVSGARLNARSLVESVAGPYPLLTVTRVTELPGGNGDGIQNPGESLAIEFSVINRGTQAAADVVATLASGAGSASRYQITQGFVEIGTLQPGEASPAAGSFRVIAQAATPTPYTEEMVVSLRYGMPQQLQVQRFNLHLYTSSVVSGRVTDLEDDAPLAGATVVLEGPGVISVTTGADGRYSATVTDGAYQVSSRAQGFLPSVAETVTSPPGRLGLDFSLGRPQLRVSPGSVTADVLRGNVDPKQITMTNHGSAPLEWSIRAREVDITPSIAGLPGVLQAAIVIPDALAAQASTKTAIPPLETSVTSLQGVTVGVVSTPLDRGTLLDDLIARGASVVTLVPPLTVSSFQEVDVILLDDVIANLSSSDLQNLQSAVQNGAGLLCEADNFGSIPNALSLLTAAGITPASQAFRDLTLTDILPHPMTAGVASLRELSVGWTLTLSGGALPLVREPDGAIHAAVSKLGNGSVVVVGNEITNASNFASGDGRRFANQIVDGLLAGPEWLAVSPLSGILAPGEDQLLTLELDARTASAGSHAAVLAVSSNIPDEPTLALPVTMNVIEVPKVLLEAERVAFGDVIERASATKDFVVTNAGTADLVLQPAVISGPGAGSFAVVLPQVLTVPAGESRSVTVAFLPSAPLGSHAALLRLATNDPRQPWVEVPVTGTHVDAPNAVMTPARADLRLFQGQTTTRIFTVKNTGKGTLTVRPRLTFTANPLPTWAEIEDNPGLLTIPRGKSAKITVRFRAGTLFPGVYATLLRCVTDDPDAPTLDAGLVLNVSAAPVPMFEGLAFPKTYVGQSQTRMLVIRNEGLNRLTLQAGRGLNAAFRPQAKFPLSIEPGSFAILPVTFAPGKAGEMYSSLVFAANVPDIFFFVPVTGTAARLPAAKVTPASLTVSTSPGLPQTRTIRVTNTGGEDLSCSLLPSAQAASWLVEKTGPVSSLASGQFQDIQVTFETEQMPAGTYQSIVRIHTNDPKRPEITVPVTLKVSSQAVLQAAPPMQDLGDLWKGELASTNFQLRNVGNLPLEVRTVTSSHVELSPGWAGKVILAPGDSVPVQSSFQSAKAQNFKGSLVVRTSSRVTSTLKLAVNAHVIEPPKMQVLPASVAESVFPNKSESIQLQVNNAGDAALNWRAELATKIDSPASAGTLGVVLQRLNARYSRLTDLIPSRFDFLEGSSGYSISDGGSNLYDTGNLLSTNLNGGQPVAYSNNVITTDQNLGGSSRYFTRKQPGLFLFAADLREVSTFRFRGNLGANSSGAASGTVIRQHGYVGFFKRVVGTSVPTLNHLVIVPDSPGLSHAFSSNTDLDDHDISGLPASTRLYALVFATGQGVQVSDALARQIMEQFILDVAHDAATPWLQVITGEGQTAPDGQSPLTVQLDAKGLAPGNYQGAFRVLGNDPETPSVEIPVTLTVPSAPVLVAEPAAISLSNIPVNAVITQPVTLRNVGNLELEITRIVGQGNGFVLAPATYPLRIPPGQVHVAQVQFAPASAGSYSGSLLVESNSEEGTPVLVPLSATSIPAPLLRVTPASITLSTRPGVSASGVITLENQGLLPLSWSMSGGLTTGVLNVISGTIAPGASREVTLTTVSTVTTPPGSSTQSITITSNDPLRPQVGLLYTRILSAEPILQITPSAISFGTLYLPGTVQRQVTLRNTGNAQLVISGVTMPAAHVTLPGTSFPLVLSAGSSRVVNVLYSPSVSDQLTGNLTFQTNNPITPELVVPVTGQAGTPPILSVSPASVSVSVEAGQSFSTAIALTNEGGMPLTWTASLSPPSASSWLSLGQLSGSSPAAGISYLGLSLSATGPAPVTRTATVTLTSNAVSNGTANVPVTLQVIPGELSVSATAIDTVTLKGVAMPSSSFGLSVRGDESPSWTVSSDVSWIQPSRLTGEGDAEISLNYAGTLAEGTHAGRVTIATENVSHVIQVTRKVLKPQFSLLQTDRRHGRLLGLVRGVSGGPSILAAIDASSLALQQVLVLPTDVTGMDLTTDERTLYAVSVAGRSLTRVNLDDFILVATKQLPATVNVGSYFQVQAGREGTVYYTDASSNPALHVYDFTRGVVVSTFRLPGLLGIGGLVLAPDERTLYVRSQTGWGMTGTAILARVDCSSDSLSQTSASSATLAQDSSLHPVLLGANLDSAITQGHFFTPTALAGGPQGRLTTDCIYNASAYLDVWVTSSQILRAEDGAVVQNLPVSTRVTAFAPDQSRLIYQHPETAALGAVDTSYLPPISVLPAVDSEVVQNVTLSALAWTGDPSVAAYDIYLSTDESAVASAVITTPGIYQASTSVTSHSLAPGQLQQGQRYYWRIDLRAADGTVTKGPVWSFKMTQAGAAPERISGYAMPGETAVQTVPLSIVCAPGISWSLSSDAAWASPDQTAGTGSATVIVSLDPATRPSGTSTASLTLTSGPDVIQIPVRFEVPGAWNVVKMLADPALPIAYALHREATAPYSSWLLWLDPETAAVQHGVFVGHSALDFIAHAADDRLLVLVDDGRRVQTVQRQGARAWQSAYPISPPQVALHATSPGRMVTLSAANALQLRQSADGLVIGSPAQVLGSHSLTVATADGSGIYAAVTQSPSTQGLVRYGVTSVGISFVTANYFPGTQEGPLLLPANGTPLIYAGQTFLPTNLNPLGSLGQKVQAVSPNGTRIVSDSTIFTLALPPVPLASLPLTTSTLCITVDGQKLLLFSPATHTFQSVTMP